MQNAHSSRGELKFCAFTVAPVSCGWMDNMQFCKPGCFVMLTLFPVLISNPTDLADSKKRMNFYQTIFLKLSNRKTITLMIFLKTKIKYMHIKLLCIATPPLSNSTLKLYTTAAGRQLKATQSNYVDICSKDSFLRVSALLVTSL